jgi:hypothetical protein
MNRRGVARYYKNGCFVIVAWSGKLLLGDNSCDATVKAEEVVFVKNRQDRTRRGGRIEKNEIARLRGRACSAVIQSEMRSLSHSE